MQYIGALWEVGGACQAYHSCSIKINRELQHREKIEQGNERFHDWGVICVMFCRYSFYKYVCKVKEKKTFKQIDIFHDKLHVEVYLRLSWAPKLDRQRLEKYRVILCTVCMSLYT